MTTQIETTLREVKMIKDLKVALKDFEPMVKNPEYLWNGRGIPNFSLREREAWGNWLLCAVLQKLYGEHITFADDKSGGCDGFIINKNTGRIVQTEHVSALDIPEGRILPGGEQRIIDAINLKIERGPKYARGRLLVVFFDGAGEFYRNKIRESIFGKHNFEAVVCVGFLNSENGYSYSVTEFEDSFGDKSITHKVEINRDFTDWKIS